MHLSKVKHSKFNESGQLAIFYAVSAAWGIDLIIQVGSNVCFFTNTACGHDLWVSTMDNGHTHTHQFNGALSGTTRVGRYQKG